MTPHDDEHVLAEAQRRVAEILATLRRAIMHRHTEWPRSDVVVAALGEITDALMALDGRLDAALRSSTAAVPRVRSTHLTEVTGDFAAVHTHLLELQRLLLGRDALADRAVFLRLTTGVSRLEDRLEKLRLEQGT